MLKTIAKPISWLSLVVLILPSFLFLIGKIGFGSVKWAMLLATIVWFVSASRWMWDGEEKSGWSTPCGLSAVWKAWFGSGCCVEWKAREGKMQGADS